MLRNVALFVLLATPANRPHAAGGSALSEEEKSFCQNEIEIVEKRRKVFERQALSDAEIARKNETQLRDLADCHLRFLQRSRTAVSEKDDAAEVQRRVGPDATPLERKKAMAEVRRERLASMDPSSLTVEERAELEAGMKEEMEATYAMRDTVHSRDPSFMRVVHSALACHHSERREQLLGLISSEESLLKLGSGNKQTLYALRAELQTSDAVLARSREASRSYEYGLDRCSSPTVSLVARCLGYVLAGKQQPACEPEEIQQYLRLVR